MSPSLLTLLCLTLTATPTPAQLDAIDEAHSCLRRQRYACALAATETLLADRELAADLRRDALTIRAQSLALDGDHDGAAALFEVLLRAGAAWRPERDAPAPVREAFLEAHRRTTEPPEVDEPPPPPEAGLSRFFASAGAGVAIPTGAAARRFDAGIHAALELGWRPSLPADAVAGDPVYGLALHLSLAFLPLNDTIIAEPGQGTTLETLSLALAGDLRVLLAPAWHLVVQAGLGAGHFSVGAASSGPALALHGSLGVLWRLDPGFGLRLDLTPTLLVPLSGEVGIGGHPAFTLRAEGAF